MSEANKELARRYFEDITNRRDFPLCPEIMAQEYTEHAIAPFGRSAPGRVIGPRATQESLEWLIAQFPDIQMTVEALIGEGDLVAVRTLSEGTNLGRLNGILPPTGKRFVARQSHWFRVENGKFAEHGPREKTCPPCFSSG